jgi:ADP-ribose pyrophosphatase YjhB (NUDIX family)
VEAFGHEVLAVTVQVQVDRLCVLLWKRAEAPHRGRWSLPGGRLLEKERMGTSIARHLAEKVEVRSVAHLEQLETRSDPRRDPRARILATAYLGIVPADQQPSVPADTAWYPVDDLPTIAFDHRSIIESGVARLRAKLTYTNIAFALAPSEFTLPELRRIYVATLGHEMSVTNLKRVLTRRGLIEQLNTQTRSGPSGGRPATRYRFRDARLHVTDTGAAFSSGQ